MLYKCVSAIEQGNPFTVGRFYPLAAIEAQGDCFTSCFMPYRLTTGVGQQGGWRSSFEVWYMPLMRLLNLWKYRRNIYQCWRIARRKRKQETFRTRR